MFRFRRPAIILLSVGVVCLGLSAWLIAARCPNANAMRNYERQATSEFLFEQRPFQFHCEDRPQPLPPGGGPIFSVIPPNAPPYAKTKAETLNIPLAEVPALTIASEPTSFMHIAGADQDFWKLHYCAVGEGSTEEEASQARDRFTVTRTGGLVSLNVAYPVRTGGHGDLLAQVPRDAPLTVHTIGAIELRNLNGPLRVSAIGGRATILNTTGTVDADGEVVDFAGARGHVMLNSYSEIDIKLTGPRFLGGISAYAQREVRVLVPRGFESPIEVMVENKKDLVCRADFCSRMKQVNQGGALIFKKFASSEQAASDHVWFRSDHSTVVIDNWYLGPIHPLYR